MATARGITISKSQIREANRCGYWLENPKDLHDRVQECSTSCVKVDPGIERSQGFLLVVMRNETANTTLNKVRMGGGEDEGHGENVAGKIRQQQ